MIKISICTVTYNHGPYLAQAIEGVLMQKGDFVLEMIVGEDCSTDNTRAVLREYAEKYPDIIKPIYHAQNVGMLLNSKLCLDACTGDYIAALEGDDYWTDPYKLQKQVGFLEANPEYHLCMHRVLKVYQDGSHPPRESDVIGREIVYFEDFIGNMAFHTLSFVFRRTVLDRRPEWLAYKGHGDWMLIMLAAELGPVRYMHEILGVYRIHSGGVFSMIDRYKQTENIIDMMYLWLEYYRGVRSEKPFLNRLLMERMNLANQYLQAGMKSKAAEQIRLSMPLVPKLRLAAMPVALKRLLGASVRLLRLSAGAAM